VFAAIAGGLLILVARPILAVWIGASVTPSFVLLAGLATWKLFEAWGIAVAAFLNGTNTIRLQAVLAVVMAAAALTLKIVFARAFGVDGVIWGTVAAYSAVSFLPMLFMILKILGRFAIR
jgi:hypothetical protein